MRFIQGRNKANRWKGSRSGAEPRGPEDCEEGYEFVRRHTEKDGTFVHAYCRRIDRKEKGDVSIIEINSRIDPKQDPNIFGTRNRSYLKILHKFVKDDRIVRIPEFESISFVHSNIVNAIRFLGIGGLMIKGDLSMQIMSSHRLFPENFNREPIGEG